MAGTAMRVNVSGISTAHPVSCDGMLRSPGSPVSCPSSPSQFYGQRLATSTSPREAKSPVANAFGARAYAATEERVHTGVRSTKNLYDLLGVSKSATPREIKAAYRMAALRLHPDVVPEDQRLEATKSFLEVQETYEILTNPQSRAAYDLSLSMNAFQSAGFSNRGPVSYGTPAWGFTSSPVAGSKSSEGFSFKGQKWETDQCW